MLRASADRLDRRRLDYQRWTPPQLEWLQWAVRVGLWRDGNSLGKSWALAAETVWRMRGTHPFKVTHRPPIKALVLSVTHAQIYPLMEKIWAFLDEGEIDVRNGFEPGRGIIGKPPRIVMTSGPGRGSELHFRTYGQSGQSLAGGQYHFIGADEPPEELMIGEVMPRLTAFRGDLRMTFTPTLDAPPLDWLRAKVEKGEIPEKCFGLKEAHCWPIGAPRPFRTQAEIDADAASYLEAERRMRIDGSWDAIVSNPLLGNFNERRHVRREGPPRGAWLGVGIDHGANAGKQAAALFGALDRESTRPRAWFWDESTSEGHTTVEQDAAAILAMLRRNGLGYDDVDEWVGDRSTGENRWGVNKSNHLLRAELARQLGRELGDVKMIRTPTKFQGSVFNGLRILNSLFGTTWDGKVQAATVHPRCAGFIGFCQTFKGDKRDPLKDVGDAHRYIAEFALHPAVQQRALRAIL